jgi:hypothetical protein
MGANTYQQTVAALQEDYNQRTGILYIAEKVRQSDIGGFLRLDSLNDTPALVLTEQETGRSYETWIFVYDGNLCEQFIPSGSPVIIQSAQVIMPMQSLSLALDDLGLLSVDLITNSGQHSSIKLATHSGSDAFNTTGELMTVKPNVPDTDSTAFGPTIMTPAPDQGGA